MFHAGLFLRLNPLLGNLKLPIFPEFENFFDVSGFKLGLGMAKAL
jgi:hypothetical protein